VTVVALVGAQYGSEGKGAIAKHIANDYQVHVRTGAPNAGHTIYYHVETYNDSGTEHIRRKKYAMRSIPCGWVNLNAHLVIGRGAVVDIDLLLSEIDEIEGDGYQVANRLYVDPMATVLDHVRHSQEEGGVEGYAHKKIGSTGEGVGLARMARLARGTVPHSAWAKMDLVEQHRDRLEDRGIRVKDTVATINSWIELGARVLLEGTQGSGLSLIHGPWPYVTTSDANAAGLMMEAGISPADFTRTILVARTFPIRVAGNSGPMENETTWEEVGVEPETTTVTKKVRRVAKWDDKLLSRALALNRPAVVALTFADYWWPEIHGETSRVGLHRDVLVDMNDRIRCIEKDHLTTIKYIGTGPDSVIEL
jgi:adenylosuccinate synthase